LTKRENQRRAFARLCLGFFLLNGLMQLCAVGIGGRADREGARGDEVAAGDATRVICTCTCCGERCPMGAKCCCDAPKVARGTPMGPYFSAMPCHPGENGATSPLLSFLGYRYLPADEFEPASLDRSGEAIAFAAERPQSVVGAPDPPPPKTSA
jgi:hypothetical protein